MKTYDFVLSFPRLFHDFADVGPSHIFIYDLIIDPDWLLLFPQLSVFSFPYCDRFTHGKQARRIGSWLGMAFTSKPWKPSYTSWCKYCWCFGSYDLDSFGIFGSRGYTQWPRHLDANGHIFSSTSTSGSFPYTRWLHLHGSSSCAFHLSSGSSDSLQDLRSLQQYQGVIHRRSSSLRNRQMSWSRTLFLWSFWQLGVVFTNSRLLAPSLRAPSITWTKPFSQCSNRPDLSFWSTWSYHEDSRFSQTTFGHFDGCYGIWGNQWNLEDDWSHELPRRDPDTSNWREFPFWVKWAVLVH